MTKTNLNDMTQESEAMDASTQIRKFQEFLQENYYAEILEKSRKGDNFLYIDFTELSKFDPQLADTLLDQPEEVLKAGEIAIQQFDLPNSFKIFHIRIKNLPEGQKLLIRNIRSKHLSHLYSFQGVVRQKSDVRPQVTSTRFECPSCGNIINVLQLDNKFKEPTRCGCGRKGKFKLLSKELVDAQSLKLEEAPEDLDGGEQPKRITVFLKNDLVSPITEKKTNPGAKISIVGDIKEVPIVLRSGAQSTRFDLMIEANSIVPLENDYSDIKISDEEVQQIKEIATRPDLWKCLIKSVVPNIYGHDRIKEALVLQLVGGRRKISKIGSINRGDIHILLIGDPGAGKSQMLKRISKIAPKGRFVSGKGVSGAGLTASVVKDEFLSGWSLEAGAMVLSNKGIVCIDELDKMSQEDTASMHEALEGQTITISKANIQATLRCETTVLAAANPKLGRFDQYETVVSQIALPPTLINRFDLIFPVKDLPEKIKDEKLAKFLLGIHQRGEIEKNEVDIDTDLFRKYVTYIRQNIHPILSDEAISVLETYYVEMRNQGSNELKSIPITARQLEGLVRLSEAYAKIRLCNVVSTEDAKKAIDILDYCLKQTAYDEEKGVFDIDRIASDTTATQRNKIMIIKDIINNLENKLGKTIPVEDIIKEAEEQGLTQEQIEEIIQKLSRSGDIYEPKRGFVSKLY